MKDACVICHNPLDDTEYRYVKYGNFCTTCSEKISYLSWLYPQPSKPCDQDELEESMRIYEEATLIFTKQVRARRKKNGGLGKTK